jgi:hypothetical protein
MTNQAEYLPSTLGFPLDFSTQFDQLVVNCFPSSTSISAALAHHRSCNHAIHTFPESSLHNSLVTESSPALLDPLLSLGPQQTEITHFESLGHLQLELLNFFTA